MELQSPNDGITAPAQTNQSISFDTSEVSITPSVTPTPQGFCMTSEEWMAYDFSALESDALVGTATNAIIRPLTKNLIVAPDKAFKTTFLMRLMASLASGQTMFPALPVLGGTHKIVYFHCELNPAELKERIIASVGEFDMNGNFINCRDVRTHLIDAEGQTFIFDTLTEYAPAIVVFDPWADLITGYNESDAKDTGIARKFILKCIDHFKITVFLVQHEGNDPTKGGRGHSAMKGWRDTLIIMKRNGDTDLVKVKVYPRWGSNVTFDLAFEDGTLVPTDLVFGSQCSKLVTFCDEHPEGVTYQQIMDAFKMKKLKSVHKMVSRAEDELAVFKKGDLIFSKFNQGAKAGVQ